MFCQRISSWKRTKFCMNSCTKMMQEPWSKFSKEVLVCQSLSSSMLYSKPSRAHQLMLMIGPPLHKKNSTHFKFLMPITLSLSQLHQDHHHSFDHNPSLTLSRSSSTESTGTSVSFLQLKMTMYGTTGTAEL